jgi:hypothetical protein
MTKIRELSVVEHAEVIGAWKYDVSKTEISKRLEILLRTIYSVIEKCNKEELERRVRKHENIPRNKDDLLAALEEEWYQIDIKTLANLVDSMSRRINAVKKSKAFN